jgi:nucleotide-binding universal stress UspA family protein
MLIRSILCPVDFSDCAENALRYALGIAEKLGAEIQLLHAYEVPVLVLPDSPAIALAAEDELRDHLSRELETLARRYSGHGVELTPRLMAGAAYESISTAARELDSDMIVMGTHGRGSLMRCLLGSVAERVVRQSTIPVCTVHAPDSSRRNR